MPPLTFLGTIELDLSDKEEVPDVMFNKLKEGFEDTDAWASYNGQPAVLIEVFRVGDQTPIAVAAATKAILARLDHTLPEGLKISKLRDTSSIFEQRADLLLKNAYLGLGLVFIFLALFLEIRLAFWVSLGIPISFLGSFLFLSPISFSINMVSMFAFIITLGIVVDDAVVVGEGDLVMTELCREYAAGHDGAGLPGVWVRREEKWPCLWFSAC